MKSQIKIIIAAALVVVLALSAISGITYSWFSDSEEREINISTATLDLEVTLDGTSQYGLATSSIIGQSLSINNLAPNSKIYLDYTVKNNSSISGIYKTEATISIPSTNENPTSITEYDLKNICINGIYFGDDFSGDIANWTETVPIKNWTPINAHGTNPDQLVISAPETYGDRDTNGFKLPNGTTWEGSWSPSTNGNKSIIVTIKTTLYQGDYQAAPLIVEGNTGSTTIPESGIITGNLEVNESTIGISASFNNIANTPGETITFTATDDIAEGFTINNAYTISISKETPIPNEGYADIIVSIPCESEPTENVTVIYVGNTGSQPISTYNYDDERNILSVAFRTTHFSDFIITTDVVTVSEGLAFKNAVEAGANVVLKESSTITVNDMIKIVNDIDSTIDFNNVTITMNKQFQQWAGNIILTDNSTSAGGGIQFDTKSILVLEDASMTIEKGRYIATNGIPFHVGAGNTTGGTATIDGGYFEGSWGAIEVEKYGKLIIENGTFTATDNPVIMTYGSTGGEGFDITVNGGTFNAGISTPGYVAAIMYLAHNGNATITNGNFIIDGGVGIALRSGHLNLSGGNFTFTNTNNITDGWVGDKQFKFKVESENVVSIDMTNPNYPGGPASYSINGHPYVVYNADETVTEYKTDNSEVNYSSRNDYYNGTPIENN